MNNDDLQVLKTQPSASQLEEILLKPTTSSAQSFELVNTLADHIVPIFEDLPQRLQTRIIDALTTLSGIESLLTRCKLAPSQNSNSLEATVLVLDRIIKQRSVVTILASKNTDELQLKKIKSLFYGSKILTTLSWLSVEKDTESEFSDKSVYIAKMKTELLGLFDSGRVSDEVFSKFLIAFLRLDDSRGLTIFDDLLSEANFTKFCIVYEISKGNKFAIQSSIIRYISGKTLQGDHKSRYIMMLSKLNLDFESFKFAIAFCHTDLLRVMVLSLDVVQKRTVFAKSAEIWGDATYINRTSLSSQKSLTNLLILLIQNTEHDALERISQEPLFLNSVTSRISSASNQARSLGMLIGNVLFAALRKEPIFKIDEEIAYQNNYLAVLDKTDTVGDTNELVQEDEVVSVSEQFETAVLADSDDELDDDEDSDDDPTVSNRNRPARPLFLKDMLSYLSADKQKDKQVYEKLRLALIHGPKLILRASVKNLRFYNEALITAFIGLDNTYEDKDFDDLRLKCLICCCVGDPRDSPEIILKSFMGGDYSLAQRTVLLSTLSLAARYLRGYDDLHFNVDEEKLTHSSKLLPPKIHSQFVSPADDRMNLVSSSIESGFIEEVMERNQEDLWSQGKILRISSKLKTPAATPSKIQKARIPDFYKLVSEKFFFPMTAVWETLHNGGFLSGGGFSGILAAHFLKSIGLVLYATFPSSTDMQDIVKESLNIVNSVSTGLAKLKSAEENGQDLLILDSALFIMLVVLDNCNEQFLANFCLSELLTFNNFLVNLVNEDVESLSVNEKVVQKCFTVSYRLNELLQKFETHLIGMS